MTRREALRAVVAIIGLDRISLREVPPYGYVDLDRARRRGWLPARVLLEGRDVSDVYRACDDVRGFVDLLRPRDGRPYLGWVTRTVATERRYGHVQFLPRRRGDVRF